MEEVKKGGVVDRNPHTVTCSVDTFNQLLCGQATQNLWREKTPC